ncbi:hypothetical protein EVA_17089 [gut metagenome]|uniref:Uncharacterized protein n=1 Tax=gut metagenome TaxID=749906 RepID=J9FZ22_9ZZZZ
MLGESSENTSVTPPVLCLEFKSGLGCVSVSGLVVVPVFPSCSSVQ